MTVGDRIKQLRKEKRLTQVELAKRLGVSQAMITQYENHQREPKKFDTIKKIAAALEVTPEDILVQNLLYPKNHRLPALSERKKRPLQGIMII